MKSLIIVCLAFGLISLAILARRSLRSQVSSDVLKRSKSYIETLSQSPVESLDREQKLLLLHSYYNVRNFNRAVAVGEALAEELETMPADRQEPFIRMVEESYWALGEMERAAEFRSRFYKRNAKRGARPSPPGLLHQDRIDL